jgi:hypothetical protein
MVISLGCAAEAATDCGQLALAAYVYSVDLHHKTTA